MRLLPLLLTSALAVSPLVACSDSDPQPGDTTAPDTSDTADVEPETTPEDTADTTPDVDDTDDTSDTSPDVDDTDDTSDTSPDVDDTDDTSDTSPDVDDTDDTSDTDVIVDYTLAIAKGNRCSELVAFEAPALPFEDADTTVGLTDNYIYTTGTACGGVGSALWGDASPDMVYAVTPAITGFYIFTLQPAAGYDPALMVTDKCPPIGEDGFLSMTCLGVSDQGTEGSRETLRVQLIAGRTYYLLVDGWNNAIPVSGAFTLSVVLGEDCTDGVDNDGNGQTDCNDVQCRNDPLCNERNYEGGCNNRVDDDRDGLTDCADPDCFGTNACNESTYPNGCTNGEDDDGDGFTDCADTDCASNDACNESTYPNGCINELDDDGDGFTDCADPNCWGIATCNEANYENGCTNDLDDDGDGRTDCADPDCGQNPNCLGSGQTCGDPIILAANVTINGTTNGRTNNYTTSAQTCLLKGASTSFGAATPDAVYSFTPTLSGRYHIQVTGNFDLGLTVTTDCNFASGMCVASERGLLADGERVVVQLEAGTTYFIIVDGWSNSNASNTGNFSLTAKLAVPSEVETFCENRVDDDLDGITDCADPDCAFDLVACTEVDKCTDGIDNDANGLTDCADPVCKLDPITCPRPPGDNCGNPIALTTTNSATINTCGYDPDFNLNVTGCISGSNNAPDVVARFTAPTAGSYWVELVGTGNLDGVLNVVRSATCPATVTRCSHSRDTTQLVEAVAVAMTANETIHIIATGDGTATRPDCGTMTLQVTALPAENCSNGVDDDRDGLTDCADPDCRNARTCNEFANGDEACTDGIDNDNDGRTDCADLDCRADTENCPSPLGDNCFNPVVIDTMPWFADFDTCAFADDVRFSSGGGCASTTTSHTAPDVVAKFVVPADGDYRVTFDTSIDGSTFDSILNVVRADTCPGSPIGECVIGSDVGNPERGTIEDAVAGEVYWIFADGWSTACSNGRLAVVQLQDEICNDGVDNDGDNLVDCADTTDCGQSPACNESVNGADACTDTIDNDNDGLTDCFDRDCSSTAACAGVILGGNCTNPFLVDTVNWTRQVDTCVYANDFNWTGLTASGCRGSTTNTASDFVVHFTPPVAGNYRVTFDAAHPGQTTWDSVINVIKNGACPSSPVAQCTSSVDGGNPERIDLSAVEGDSFFIIVDGWSSACNRGRISIVRLDDEICDDNLDNDGDGRTDCADSDCFGVGTCPAAPPGENCSSPMALTLNQDRVVDTCNFLKDFTIPGGGGCISTTAAPDMLLTFTAASAGNYRFTINASWLDYETVTNFVRGETCPTSPVTTCTAANESSSGTPNQTRDLALAAGETLWIVLGANFSETECGTATLRVTPL